MHGRFRPGASPPPAFPHLQTLIEHKSHDGCGVQRPQRPRPGPLLLVVGRRRPPGFGGLRAEQGAVPCGGGQRRVKRAGTPGQSQPPRSSPRWYLGVPGGRGWSGLRGPRAAQIQAVAPEHPRARPRSPLQAPRLRPRRRWAAERPSAHG